MTLDRPPRLVCFDIGGVLVRTCRTWAEGCAAAGLPDRSAVGGGEESIGQADLHHLHQIGRLDADAYARRVSERLGGLYTPQEILDIHFAWLRDEYAGVGELIEALHELRVATAALSNTNHRHWERLPAYPAIGRLGHRLASHELGLCKPDPAIYRAAEQRLGAGGAEILFFDDRPENVEAAADAGWRAVQVDPTRETAPQMTAALREQGLSRFMLSL